MICISLTTTPRRLAQWDTLRQSLETLLSQETLEEYKVVLNIPPYFKAANNQKYIIHEELKGFVLENSKLVINQIEEDHGLATKYLGALSLCVNPEDILIFCNDDCLYHNDMIESYLKIMGHR